MTVASVSLIVLAATAVLIGGYLLIRCISSLGRMIFPKVRVRFSASGDPLRMTIPQPGRYVINVLIPPFSVFTGVSHFDAKFSVATYPSGASLDFRSYGRSLFQVKRTDMTGKQAEPLGSFECAAPGEILITCQNPEVIRTNYLLEVSPHVPPFVVFLVILATIASSAMVIGGFVFSILWMSGKV